METVIENFNIQLASSLSSKDRYQLIENHRKFVEQELEHRNFGRLIWENFEVDSSGRLTILVDDGLDDIEGTIDNKAAYNRSIIVSDFLSGFFHDPHFRVFGSADIMFIPYPGGLNVIYRSYAMYEINNLQMEETREEEPYISIGILIKELIKLKKLSGERDGKKKACRITKK